MVRKIIKRQILSISEVKEMLEKHEKKRELTYTQRITLDYASKFSKLSSKSAKELAKKLITDFEIDEETAYQIVNALPLTLEELSVFLGGTKIFTEEELKKIVELIKTYVSKNESSS